MELYNLEADDIWEGSETLTVDQFVEELEKRGEYRFSQEEVRCLRYISFDNQLEKIRMGELGVWDQKKKAAKQLSLSTSQSQKVFPGYYKSFPMKT